MDKSTLSQYGWVTIVIIIIVILLGFAFPVGNFLSDSTMATLDTFTKEITAGSETRQELLEKSEYFYSALNLAVTDINNNEIGVNADVDKEHAVAGVYLDEDNTPVAVLLKDSTEDVRSAPSVDMTIKLGGNNLSVNDAYAIDIISGNIVVDGRIKGSSITMDYTTSISRCVQSRYADSLVVDGGTYVNNSVCSNNAAAIFSACDAVIRNVTIDVNSPESNTTYGIWVPNNNIIIISNSVINSYSDKNAYGISTTSSECDISDCNVYTESSTDAHGISNRGVATIVDSDILAVSPYLPNDTETSYIALSMGIDSYGPITIKNCNVKGTLAGVSSYSDITVDGGTYEGYGHGGFYLVNDGPVETYIQNAKLVDCAWFGPYETLDSMKNGSGIYIGGSSQMNGEITEVSNGYVAYMDNCDIVATRQAIVLRGVKELNHTLYVSNTTISEGIYVRIDSDTHKLYIGRNCNFTKENCVKSNFTAWDEETLNKIVIYTDEVYAKP